MMKEYHFFLQLLEQEKKDAVVNYVITLLDTKQITIEELYLEWLSRSLLEFRCKVDDKEVCIWKEHYRTSMIRTIIECTYPYILERLKTTPKIPFKVVVLTPTQEYHEIGALIITNLMVLLGLDAAFIGANTPKEEIISAVRAFSPDYVAMSVTNPYNLVVTKKITDALKETFPTLKVILGGQAFQNYHTNIDFKVDYIMNQYQDLLDFVHEVKA